MSRVNKMNLKDILDKVHLILRENDIIYFCDEMDVIKGFIQNFTGRVNNREQIKQYLIDNEQYIDKEKLVLLTVKNYTDNIELIQKKIKKLTDSLNTTSPENLLKELSDSHIQLNAQEQSLKQAKMIGKGIENFLTFYYFDEEDERYKIDIVDSREIIDGKKISNSKNLKRFDEIDLYFKGGDKDQKFGMEYVLQAILLTDLYELLPNEHFGNDVRTMILENEILKRGIKTRPELEALKSLETYDEYTILLDSTDFEGLLPDLKITLRELCKYIDIDKLLLISAYRFYEGIENERIDPKLYGSVKEILKGINNCIKNQNIRTSCQLQSKKDDSYDMEQIEYSVKDIKTCLDKFAGVEYLTDKRIKGYRNQVINQDINLLEIEPKYIDIIFNIEELEELAVLSDENFRYVSSKLEWNKDKIIQAINRKNSCSTILLQSLATSEQLDSKDIIDLYINSKITLEQIKVVENIIDLSENVNSYELIQYYKNSIEKDSNQDDKGKFNQYLELYKEVLINNKSEEELEENYNNLVNSLLDNYKGKEYIKVIEEYYTKGLVTLEVLLEWNGEDIITSLYEDGIINIENIKELVKSNKLSFDYINNIYSKLVNNENIDYDQRLDYIKTGYVAEREIFKMYENGQIFEKDLRDLAQNGIVRIDQTEKIINNRTKEDLEKNSSIRLVGLNNLTKINNDIYCNDEEEKNRSKEYDIKTESPKLLIDPNKREEYINLFNAYQAETDLEEDSPFYDYEFYVIPDESGEIGLNSVVIAERYYDDKDTEEKFALNNATYFFRYKDLMVLSNLKKSEMTKERENVVFTAKHILADEKKNGYWASGVIYGISKTMLSSDLKDYTKTEQRRKILDKLNEIYSEEQVLEILDMASKIDRGEYTYEIIDPESKALRKSVKTKKKEKDYITDNDGSR